jgi:hypothetical protein
MICFCGRLNFDESFKLDPMLVCFYKTFAFEVIIKCFKMLIKLGKKKIAGLVCFWNDIGQEPTLPARVQELLFRLRLLAFLGLDERGLLRRRGCWAAGSGASSRGGGVVIAFRFLLSISKEMARCYWDEEASGLAIHPDYGPI